MSLRYAAITFGIKKSTLYDRVLKAKNKETMSDSGNGSSDQESSGLSKYVARQVFSVKEELELEVYLKQSSQILYCLTYTATRTLAYDYTLKRRKLFLSKMAGIEWMKSFMKRHPKLSLQEPENTRVGRASAFNKHNDTFFHNYIEVQELMRPVFPLCYKLRKLLPKLEKE